MPDPVREGEVMGVELQVGGRAQSIDMATLPYASWELQGEPGKLILHGQSIGNGQTIDVTDTAVLGENGGVPTLTIEDRVSYTPGPSNAAWHEGQADPEMGIGPSFPYAERRFSGGGRGSWKIEKRCLYLLSA